MEQSIARIDVIGREEATFKEEMRGVFHLTVFGGLFAVAVKIICDALRGS